MNIKVSIKNCARCDKDHKDLEFKKLKRDTGLYDSEGDGPYTHWTMCPEIHEPILLVIGNGDVNN